MGCTNLESVSRDGRALHEFSRISSHVLGKLDMPPEQTLKNGVDVARRGCFDCGFLPISVEDEIESCLSQACVLRALEVRWQIV